MHPGTAAGTGRDAEDASRPRAERAGAALTAGDRRDHVDERAGLERRVEPRPLAIDVDVNVLPDLPGARVAQPVAQPRPLGVEPVDRVVDRRRLEVEAAR